MKVPQEPRVIASSTARGYRIIPIKPTGAVSQAMPIASNGVTLIPTGFMPPRSFITFEAALCPPVVVMGSRQRHDPMYGNFVPDVLIGVERCG
jgi:hypothetical protein